MGLENRVVLLTGAASGIGKSTAMELARQSATLILSDINVEQGEELAETLVQEFSVSARFVKADVCKAEEIKALIADVMAREKRLDCVVNNAGVDHIVAPLHECENDWLDKVVDVNLKGVFYCMKYAIREMLKQRSGVIVNVASIAGVAGAALFGPYAASKHGVVGLTKSAAQEYATSNIRINAVCPGFIKTPMYERAATSAETERKLMNRVPMKRAGDPDEIANAISWLCSQESSYMTGHAMILDGGFTS